MPELPTPQESSCDIAIVGMACNVPGAKTLDEYWYLLRSGQNAVRTLSADELKRAGVDSELASDPNYVPVRGILDNVEMFDADFFGMSPREAELTDPQQRHFLECAWSAVEDAGYDPRAVSGSVGVYAGSGWNSYLLLQLASQADLLRSDAGHQALLGNEKDNLTTRLSYKLNLTGPSVAIQTGCSSSLVAISMACQSLLEYQSDMAISGGVSITVPQGGYLHRQGSILSKDGQCRAFDCDANGTVLGNGVGVVVLKRLEDALADKNHIYAVIKATAINNDGARKAGFTAPSVDGQASCIAECHSLAGISSDSISYVEAHGTGTEVGDPIEIAALKQAFGPAVADSERCLIGSVKTNIGHLDAAAGVVGLIKVALMLHHKEVVPTLHFNRPNPNLNLESSRFEINTTHIPWPLGTTPRRAGVSSFGLGGTNAHAVLEEAPFAPIDRTVSTEPQLLVLSARSSAALKEVACGLSRHLRMNMDTSLAAAAFTLRQGRTPFQFRRFIVARDILHAIEQLDLPDHAVPPSVQSDVTPVQATLLFPGQGSQYVGMACGAYQSNPTFRHHLDRCLGQLARRHDIVLQDLLCSDQPPTNEQSSRLTQTAIAQPALFAVCYALARTWMDAGVQVHSFIGHSIGEIVAATLAGVFSFDDALALVVARGALTQGMPKGSMMAVSMPEDSLRAVLPENLDIAVVNDVRSCVVSGSDDAIALFKESLMQREVACQHLHTSHAFHSRMMDGAVAPFVHLLESMTLHAPALPFMSNVTGKWITNSDATDPHYWGRHLRQTVRFADGLNLLFEKAPKILLEAGPGQALTKLLKRHPALLAGQMVITSMSDSNMGWQSTTMLEQFGQLWMAGCNLNWSMATPGSAQRIRLPTYPFQRQRHWINALSPLAPPKSSSAAEIWTALLQGAESHSTTALAKFDRPTHSTRKEALNLLCVAYINRAMQKLRLFGKGDIVYPADQLLLQSNVSASFRQLFLHMLTTLVRHQQLRKQHDGYSGLQLCSDDALSLLLQQARLVWAGEEEVVELSVACGEALVAVLQGTQAPLELFTSVLAKVQAPVQAGATLHDAYNTIIRGGVEAILQRLPEAAPIRVLEIGGGTGVATTALLPALPADRTHYQFTDIGGYFVAKAKEKFGSYPFVDFSVLNIDCPPHEQGLVPHQYDIVIAVNMLHVTRSIATSLQHVRSMLAPGGVLLIWEITRSAPDFDVTYGLLMDAIHDGRRNQGDPFFNATEWTESLQANGFSQVKVLPNDGFFEEQVILAQADVHSEGTLFGGAAPRLPRSPVGMPSTLLDKKGDISDWFHEISWRRRAQPRINNEDTPANQRWLVLCDVTQLGLPLSRRLRSDGEDVVTVVQGDRYLRESPQHFVIRSGELEDYVHLLMDLQEDQWTPNQILHLWGIDSAPLMLAADVAHINKLGHFEGLLYLAQALGEHLGSAPIGLTVLSDDLHEVTGYESLEPSKALLLGFTHVVGLEYPHIQCRNIDLSMGGLPFEEQWLGRLVDELRHSAAPAVVALRGEHRWVRGIEPMRLPPVKKSPGQFGRLRHQGVYLITGGLGKIGLALASHLSQSVAARLVLVSRTQIPAEQDWQRIVDDTTHARELRELLGQLLKLKESGGEVCVVQADVADALAMENAVRLAELRFGVVHGVIHSAGLLGDGAIQDKSLGQINAVLRPKVIGTMVLDEIFKQRPLDFFVLFSSLSALKPGFGQLAYCAANNFADAFARARSHRNTICLSWDVWKGEGMAYDATAPALIEQIKQSDFMQRGLSTSEGVEVFMRALECQHRHVLVCTSDYLHADSKDMAEIYATKAESVTRPSHPLRLQFKHNYVAPGTEIEHTLSQIWGELLGIADIGIDDDFFVLGGDSLIGTLLVSRILARLNVRLPTRSVHECRTIRAIGVAVEDAILAQASDDELDEALQNLHHI